MYMKESYESIYSGAIGGVIGSYLSHPLDTIKTKIQSYQSYKNIHVADNPQMRNILTQNKDNAYIQKRSRPFLNGDVHISYFAGAHPRALMAFINMMISLNCYDYFKKYVENIN